MIQTPCRPLIALLCAFALLCGTVGCAQSASPPDTSAPKLTAAAELPTTSALTTVTPNADTLTAASPATPTTTSAATPSTAEQSTAAPSTATPTTETPTTEAPTTATPTTQTPISRVPMVTYTPEIEDDQTPDDVKRVAFTFDDGPSSTLTYKFVDKLNEYGAHATFFVIGNRVAGRSVKALQYAVANGNEVGIHAYTHDYYFTKCSEEKYQEEVSLTHEVINTYIEGEVRLMRPPGGKLSKEQIAASPYSIVLWSVDSLDWQYKKNQTEEDKPVNVQTIVDNVLGQVQPGDIVLMHEIYENSYDAFCIIIDELYKQGYEIVTVSELFKGNLEPGVKYRDVR